MTRPCFVSACVLLVGGWVLGQPATQPAGDSAGEQVRIATYNIEHLMMRFDQLRMPERSRNQPEQWQDEEDLFEIARVINLPEMDAEILCIQESCDQPMLEFFNRRWLNGKYSYVEVFPGNTDGQWVAMMAKPGFTVQEVRKEYYKEADPVRGSQGESGGSDDEGEAGRLFGRGPAFVRFQTPAGNSLWVGVTHAKSKRGNDEAMTRLRVRELERFRAIGGELLDASKANLMLLAGDINDEIGLDRYEQKVGRDAAMAVAEGQGSEQFVHLTEPMVKQNPELASFHCLIKTPQFRGTIDHLYASPALAEHLVDTRMITNDIAYVASDHLPIVAEFRLPAAGAAGRGKATARQASNGRAPSEGHSASQEPSAERRPTSPGARSNQPQILDYKDRAQVLTLATAEQAKRDSERALFYVEGVVEAINAAPSGKIAFLTLVGASNRGDFQLPFFAPIFDQMGQTFGGKLGEPLAGKKVRIAGELTLYRGNPQMVISSPEQITVLD